MAAGSLLADMLGYICRLGKSGDLTVSNREIAIIYFSATDVTRTYATVMADELRSLGCEARIVDVTPYASRQRPLSVGGFDGIIFGFPVYADFAPTAINGWPCSTPPSST